MEKTVDDVILTPMYKGEVYKYHECSNCKKEIYIEEDIKNAEHFIKSIKTDKEYKEDGWHGYYNKEIVELARILQHILSDYKKLQEEFKQVDRECERLEEKEVRLIEENEYYKDLLNALETYYDITEEDLEKCIKDDR